MGHVLVHVTCHVLHSECLSLLPSNAYKIACYTCVCYTCVLSCTCLLLNLAAFALGVFGSAPMQCDLSVLVTLQADFLSLSQAQTSG